MKRNLATFIALFALARQGHAQQFLPLGKTLFDVIKAKDPKNVPTRTFTHGSESIDAFYTKDGGKLSKLAFVQKGVYPPNCTHTWVIGVNPKSFKVDRIEVIEMSCPHAFPTRSKSFLGQFTGKGPADLNKIKKVTHIAKATGSSDLTKDAVIKSITLAKKHAGEL